MCGACQENNARKCKKYLPAVSRKKMLMNEKISLPPRSAENARGDVAASLLPAHAENSTAKIVTKGRKTREGEKGGL